MQEGPTSKSLVLFWKPQRGRKGRPSSKSVWALITGWRRCNQHSSLSFQQDPYKNALLQPSLLLLFPLRGNHPGLGGHLSKHRGGGGRVLCNFFLFLSFSKFPVKGHFFLVLSGSLSFILINYANEPGETEMSYKCLELTNKRYSPGDRWIDSDRRIDVSMRWAFCNVSEYQITI